MSRNFLYNKFAGLMIIIACCLLTASFFSFKNLPVNPGIVKVTFINTANGEKIFLRDSLYKNSFDEEYSVSKLKYYISNFSVEGTNNLLEKDPYHLINAADSNNSFELELMPGNYKSISFLLGVDSAHNCSGAQTGALDPMNDMFWTWNSGYVMLKLEGNSPASTADLQRIEHHIGGYKGLNNVCAKINLLLPETKLLQVKENAITEITIETNLDHYWKDVSDTKISENPVCTLPGALAKKIASNFYGMFSVKSIR